MASPVAVAALLFCFSGSIADPSFIEWIPLPPAMPETVVESDEFEPVIDVASEIVPDVEPQIETATPIEQNAGREDNVEPPVFEETWIIPAPEAEFIPETASEPVGETIDPNGPQAELAETDEPADVEETCVEPDAEPAAVEASDPQAEIKAPTEAAAELRKTVEPATSEDPSVLPDPPLEAETAVPEGNAEPVPEDRPTIRDDGRIVPEAESGSSEETEIGPESTAIEGEPESVEKVEPVPGDDASSVPDVESQTIDEPVTAPDAEITWPIDEEVQPADSGEPWNFGCAPLQWL